MTVNISKDTLVELLTDIIAASDANDGERLLNSISKAREELVNVGLWKDEEITGMMEG